MLDYLDLSLETVKQKLVECKPDEVGRLQGEALAYEKLLKLIRVGKADIAAKGNE